MPKSNFYKALALSLGVLAMIFSLSYVVMAWTESTTPPATPNLPAPITAGTSTQTKLGSLTIMQALNVNGTFSADGGAPVIGTGLNVIVGKVAIGTSTAPSFPLSIGGKTFGNKIGLYDMGSGTGFGFGAQDSLLQIFANATSSRVGIGYGNSSAFKETLTIAGSNVGIGIIPATTSAYRLDVNGRINASGTISGVSTPILGKDAANKAYVDAAIAAAGGGSCYYNYGGSTCTAGWTAVLSGFTTIYLITSNPLMVQGSPASLECSSISHSTGTGASSNQFIAESMSGVAKSLNDEPCAICCK